MDRPTVNQLEPVARDYLRLALRLEKHLPGFVDAYVGPVQLRDEIAAEATRPPVDLVAEATALREAIATGSFPALRRRYLATQAAAMLALSRKLAGEPISFVDEVRRCFDIEPVRTPDAEFEAAIAEVDRALPGTGPLPARMSEWRQQFVIAPELAIRLIEERIAPEVRRRTSEIVALPKDEAVEFRLVTNQPWSGYNWYLGQARSRVEINTDLPLYANTLTDLVCHEAYPGHHTEHALKEALLYHEQRSGSRKVRRASDFVCS